MRKPVIKISSAGRHGRLFRVTLVGARGYELVDWTRASFADAMKSAEEELPGIEIVMADEVAKASFHAWEDMLAKADSERESQGPGGAIFAL